MIQDVFVRGPCSLIQERPIGAGMLHKRDGFLERESRTRSAPAGHSQGALCAPFPVRKTHPASTHHMLRLCARFVRGQRSLLQDCLIARELFNALGVLCGMDFLASLRLCASYFCAGFLCVSVRGVRRLYRSATRFVAPQVFVQLHLHAHRQLILEDPLGERGCILLAMTR